MSELDIRVNASPAVTKSFNARSAERRSVNSIRVVYRRSSLAGTVKPGRGRERAGSNWLTRSGVSRHPAVLFGLKASIKADSECHADCAEPFRQAYALSIFIPVGMRNCGWPSCRTSAIFLHELAISAPRSLPPAGLPAQDGVGVS